MTKVAIITTGGTIAMSGDRQSGGVKPKDPDVLPKSMPDLSQYADVEMDAFSNLPSPHITPEVMLKLSQRVHTYLNRSDISGIVVTHGTDTMEETAYFLDLVLPPTKPVVLTGAMRSSDQMGADGPFNLTSAVRVAASPQATGKGVVVVFNGEIHAARWVTKTHTSNLAAFRSPHTGPIGFLTQQDVVFTHLPQGHETIGPIDHLRANVAIVKAASGTDDLFVHAALDAGVDGIVLEALGQGNIPPQMTPGVKRALKLDVPVVIVSRCLSGVVQDVYGYEGGGQQLKEWGVLFTDGLNAQKARIKLMLALSKTQNIGELRKLFD